MSRGLFVFRRDLRLEDNLGLIALMEACDEVAAIFVGTPEQIFENRLQNRRAVAFQLECLEELAGDLKRRGGSLQVAQGDPVDEVMRVVRKQGVNIVGWNRDYTPQARERDARLESGLRKEGVGVMTSQDYGLCDVEGIRSGGSGGPQRVFTPFWRAAEGAGVMRPVANRRRSGFLDIGGGAGFDRMRKQGAAAAERLVRGGRSEGLRRLRGLGGLRGQKDSRHMMDTDTSLMSAYHKFGCVSVRESQWRSVELWGRGNAWARQLFWRDFQQHRVFFWGDTSPSVYKIGAGVKWPGGVRGLREWKEGRTGVPVVDAGMRQLAAVGQMHNRARMVVANFLTRNLMINWREGERWFAEQLTDQDFSVNFMNWLGIAGVFKGDQPWRMMNPWIQSKKHDPDSAQVRQWVPELADVESDDIHRWFRDDVRAKQGGSVDYPAPIVDYEETRDTQLVWVRSRGSIE